jgi:hypothetical protein
LVGEGRHGALPLQNDDLSNVLDLVGEGRHGDTTPTYRMIISMRMKRICPYGTSIVLKHEIIVDEKVGDL